MRKIFITLNLIYMCGVLSACSTAPEVKFGEYYTREVENLEKISAEIEKRNTTLEQHPEWISRATRDFMIKELLAVSHQDYLKYRQYLDDGDLYVIVHPAYSIFFHDLEPLYASRNPVDSFLNETTYTKNSRFIREQERSLRDLVEITSTRKRLILFVLPGNYREYDGYIYKYGPDMFARYINSITNESESVLYLYSEKPNRGRLSDRSKNHLIEFFDAVNPKRIIIGGGYIGRCLEDFYKDISSSAFGEKIMIAGEISAFSQDDLNRIDVDDFMNQGKLNIEALKEVVTLRGVKGISFKQILKNYKNYKNNSSN